MQTSRSNYTLDGSQNPPAEKHLPSILIVDDEPHIRTFLRTTLTSHDYQVSEAEKIADALKILTVHPPDVMLLDLGLPDLEGGEVCRRLRVTSQVPIIVLSARGADADALEIYKLSAAQTG